MDNETETADSSNSETNDTEVVAAEGETLDAAALKAERDELAQTNRQLFERAKKAEGFVKVDGKWVKAPKPEEAIATAQKLEAKTGELDETQLDYLDLKGITEDEDITVIQSVIKRTGQTVRQALKDDYVQTKLTANKEKRAVQNAMPGNTKRGGAAGGIGLDAAIAKYEQTNELPDEFELRSKVIEAKMNKENATLPPWRR